jgi:hypothetical protein
VLRHTATSGKAVSNFRIAVNDGEQPTYHRIVAWGRTAEVPTISRTARSVGSSVGRSRHLLRMTKRVSCHLRRATRSAGHRTRCTSPPARGGEPAAEALRR